VRSSNAFVVLAALVSAGLPTKLGTAIMVQYLRNPVDAADARAAITELMSGEGRSGGISPRRGVGSRVIALCRRRPGPDDIGGLGITAGDFHRLEWRKQTTGGT
jgi:hypothetical protein